jgi:hypothetical protein
MKKSLNVEDFIIKNPEDCTVWAKCGDYEIEFKVDYDRNFEFELSLRGEFIKTYDSFNAAVEGAKKHAEHFESLS